MWKKGITITSTAALALALQCFDKFEGLIHPLIWEQAAESFGPFWTDGENSLARSTVGLRAYGTRLCLLVLQTQEISFSSYN